MAMKKVELTMFLFRQPDGTERFAQHDLTKGGTDDFFVRQFGACMGQVVIIGEYEDVEGDPREKLIEGLEKAVDKERAESQVRVNLLLERISQLKCLTHETAES